MRRKSLQEAMTTSIVRTLGTAMAKVATMMTGRWIATTTMWMIAMSIATRTGTPSRRIGIDTKTGTGSRESDTPGTGNRTTGTSVSRESASTGGLRNETRASESDTSETCKASGMSAPTRAKEGTDAKMTTCIADVVKNAM